MNVLEVIQSTTAYLTKYKIENPRLNSEQLVAHVLDRKRIELYMEFDRPLHEKDLIPLRELLRKRSKGEPLQHLIGTVEFYGRTFSIDARALVPRPETEQLIELILKEKTPITTMEAPRILDVGTGSGIIPLTLAAELETSLVHAVDLSNEALALAQENAARLNLVERVKFQQSDLFSNVDGTFHLIVANLPYIPSELLSSLSLEVQHDPRMALDGGTHGLEILLRFVGEAPKYLASQGRLAMEIGHDQADRLIEEMNRLNYKDILSTTDYQGVRRFLFATYG